MSQGRGQGTIWILAGIIVFALTLGSVLMGVPFSSLDREISEAAISSEIEGIENPQHLPVLLEFSLDICIPCRRMKPILEEVTKEYQGKLLVKILEIEDYPYLVRQFDIRVVPTQIFLDSQGKVFRRHEGFLDRASLDGVLNQMGVKR
jgi:thioredoxin-like negative regulator of GroEL